MRKPAVITMALLLLVVGCDGDETPGTDAAPPTGTRPTQPETTTTVPAPTSTAPATQPTPVPVEHGREMFGVYLSVERGAAPTAETRAAQAEAERNKWPFSGGDINCDQGAREALRLDPARDYYAVAVYFVTREDAQRFVDLYEPGVVGIAAVKVFCAD